MLLSTCCVAQSDPDPTNFFHDITIPAGQKLNSATCFLCSIHVEGELKDDATAQWGNIEVRGAVGGNAVAVAGSVHLYPDAKVQGDVVSVFGDTALDDRTQVQGDVVASWGLIERAPTAQAKSENATGFAVLSKLSPAWRCAVILWVIGIAISIPLAFLCYWLFGRARLEKMLENFQKRRVTTFLLGALALAALAGAMLLAAEGSIPEVLEPALTCLLILLLVPGYTAISLWMGRRDARSPKLALLIGVLLLVTIQVIPILGWILSIVLTIVSLGNPGNDRLETKVRKIRGGKTES